MSRRPAPIILLVLVLSAVTIAARATFRGATEIGIPSSGRGVPPSAADEAGEQPVATEQPPGKERPRLESPASGRARRAVPRRPEVRSSARPTVKAPLPVVAKQPLLSSDAGMSRAASGKAAAAPAPPVPGVSQLEEGRYKGAVAVAPGEQASSGQADVQIHTPPSILVPPRLLEPQVSLPSEAYAITLDRGAIAPELRAQALEGRVLLRILVRADGGVARVEVERSSGIQILDQAAADAAWRWTFHPATRDGVPIEAWAIVPVRFVMP